MLIGEFKFQARQPYARREPLKFKLTNQNSANWENCAIRGYVKSLHSDWLDGWTFAQRSLVFGFLSHKRRETEITNCFVSLLLTIDLPIQFL